MYVQVTNVNHALEKGMRLLAVRGLPQASRAGNVVVLPTPVMFCYTQPLQRVLFNWQRNANPFFHFMEALWMLNGNDDVDFVAQFVNRMRDFSDNGVILNGAYGYRWRAYFNRDQLARIADMLRADVTERRAVLAMWDGYTDLFNPSSKDLPCNTHIYFRVRDEMAGSGAQVVKFVLDMTVLCRSNDAVWGAHGANAVHFSMLQEYMAYSVGVGVGKMYQFANNYHSYTDRYDPADCQFSFVADNHYNSRTHDGVTPYPMMGSEDDVSTWDQDLAAFISDPGGDTEYRHSFFNHVAAPMYLAWTEYKAGNPETALVLTSSIAATDWRLACEEWLHRAVAARRSA